MTNTNTANNVFFVRYLATKEELEKISDDDLGEVAFDLEKQSIIHKCRGNNNVWETYRFFDRKERDYGISSEREKEILTGIARKIIDQSLEDVKDLP